MAMGGRAGAFQAGHGAQQGDLAASRSQQASTTSPWRSCIDTPLSTELSPVQVQVFYRKLNHEV